MDRPTLFALTAPAALDPAIANAACRAGAVGVLDIEYVDDSGAFGASLRRLEQFTSSDFGVRVAPSCAATAIELLKSKPARLRYVILAGGVAAWDDQTLAQLREATDCLLAEVVSTDEARQAAAAGADGLILKGNEAGGRVGPETSYILVQHWRAEAERDGFENIPFWVQGGIGANSAAACAVAGAAGVVLDSQLLLTTESPLDETARARLRAVDGAESVELGRELGAIFRLWTGPNSEVLRRLEDELAQLTAGDAPLPERQARWRDFAEATIRAALAQEPLLACGQDAALARPLADRFVTTGGVLVEVRERIDRNRELAHRLKPLAPQAPLAESHGTRYPLLQGPMTRVSDTAAFAREVAAGGALPFLALALMRGPEAEKVIAETKSLVADRPWGVGILGFLPAEIRDEQYEAILKYRPPFAIIAGGRPDQAKRLEDAGISVYLHVPSPGLLRMFLRSGARRFIFEGRECGGHVGPRSSFVLWETMSEALQEHLGPRGDGSDLHVVFAGGIHDSLSSAMLACLAAPLAERGVKIGALMGTAYLYTREAVESGAIVPRFQNEAISARDTVLYETGPGHAVRCLRTPYFDAFNAEKRRLRAEGRSHDEIVQTLEWMNVGRLRVASKGLDRAPTPGGASKLAPVEETQQYERGMYMIGQVAALHDRTTTIADLHHDVCAEGTKRLEPRPAPPAPAIHSRGPCDVAIIGMSAFYPGALGLDAYWENILNRHNAVTEIPPTHWDWRLYYDPDQSARDKVVSKWGGFLGDVPFDPFEYGITPKSIPSIEPLQLLVLEGVRRALRDAGYDRRPFDRENTCTVLGVGGGGSALAVSYGLRACLPMFDAIEGLGVTSAEMLEKLGRRLPEWTEDSFPGILLNVAAGRVANRFDFGGSNYALDAACASSLAAVHACVRELEMGTCNVAVAVGADTVQTPYAYVAFSKTHALSKCGRCRPFDAAADGIVLAEGIGAVILKRLADAERDGDHIYAVIKGVGSSSDGMDKGLTAPNSAGQIRAINRCFARAGYSPADVTLIEAHGTGTVVGDRTEAMSLSQVMDAAGAERQSCALGSVKSMIGHSKCAAGIAGLIKTAKALERKTLPPTLVETPNPNINFAESALYLNTEPRPWVHDDDRPRRAGVSSFGFGGTNVHLTMEEYRGDFLREPPPALDHWPAELLVWQAPSREELIKSLDACRTALEAGARPELRELAASLWRKRSADRSVRVAIVAASLDELPAKLASAARLAQSGDEQATDPRGVYFSAAPAEAMGKVAFVFPGQGSQYPNMLAPLAMNFPLVRATLDEAQHQLADKLPRRLSSYLYPPSPFSDEDRERSRQALAATDVAQSALGATSVAVARMWAALGLEPDLVAGHSYGEFTALWAAGVIATDDLLALSHARGALIQQATMDRGAGGMVAIDGDAATAEKLAEGLDGVSLANINAPAQTVLSAADDAIDQLLQRAREQNVRARRLPVACAFHSPLVAGANEYLARRIAETAFQPPRKTAFSNVTAQPYPSDAAAIREVLSRHLASPVRFMDEIEAMYAAGARVFVEAGPNNVLTSLVGRILEGKPHLAIATDVSGRDGLEQLMHAVGQLFAHGASVRLDKLFDPRNIPTIDLSRLAEITGEPKYTPSTWLVNGVRSRLHNAPEPELMGTRMPSSSGAPPAASSVASAPRDGAAVTKPVVPTSKSSSKPSTMSEVKNHTTTSPAPTSAPSRLAATPLMPTPLADEAAQVMLGFQQTMSKFLDTQRAIMVAYLQGGGDVADAIEPPAAQPLLEPMPELSPQVAPASAPAPPPVETAPAVDEQAQSHGEPSANGSAADHPQSTALAPAPAANGHSGLANWNIEAIGAKLLDLLSERTGYPKEMLNLDLDLEADLGIDSIKRVEILGGLTESLNGDGADLQSRLDLEKLTSRRSLRGILNYLDDVLFAEEGEVVSDEPQRLLSNGAPETAQDDHPRQIHRGLVSLVEAPLPASSAPRIPSGAVIITDDGRGVAQQIADRLADFGQATAIVSMASHSGGNGAGYAVDLTSPEAVAGLATRLRAEFGNIGGLVHCLPLAPLDESTTLVERARRDVKSLYLLARAFESDLRAAGSRGGSLLLAATALGGELGYGQRELLDAALAAHGGILGFIKCVGLEWPETLVRAVDFDASRPPSQIADALLRELSDSHGPLEVGYRDRTRITWKPEAAPLATGDDRERSPLPAGSTVLVTGGARGITAEIAVALGERYQPNLVIVGRSPLPADVESADTAGLSEPAAIKQALMARLASSGKQPTPAEVETIYRELQRDREIRANLARLRATGASVEYHSVDVRDREALAALIADVTARYGRIDGLIHGAGVIEDKLLRDKTPESFDRVFGVKVESAWALSELLDPEDLKFCVFFASIASRYGNRGQSDYAAANEVLGKLALELDRRWPARVFSVAWGPWTRVGMVADLEPHLESRGVALIDPQVGCERLIEELEFGWKGESEVLIAGGAEHVVKPPARVLEQALA